MDKKELRRYAVAAVLLATVCIVVQNFNKFTGTVSVFLDALSPMLLGCIIAYIFNIIMRFFENKYFPKREDKIVTVTRRPVCLLLSFAVTIAVIAVILNIIIPEMENTFKLIYSLTPQITDEAVKLKDMAVDKLKEYPELQKQISSIELDKSSIVDKVTDKAVELFDSAINIVQSVTSTVTDIVIALIFSIYLLLRKDKLLHDINRIQNVMFSDRINRPVNHFFDVAHKTFTNFFIGQFTEAIILGTLTFIGSSLLKLPYSAMTGTLVGVTALIPIVGAFIGAGLSAVIIFTDSPRKAIVFLVFLLILQQIEGNLIYPKVVGSSVGLPGIWVLAAVTVGGGIGGIMGMVVGVPLAATVYKLGFELLEAREKKLGIAEDFAEKTTEKKKKTNILKRLMKAHKKEKK